MSRPPTLVADIGYAHTRGAVVGDGRTTLLREPAGGSPLWPTAVALAPGRPEDPLIAGTPAVHRRRLAPESYRHDFLRDLGHKRPLWIGGREFPARACVGAVLAALRAEAERTCGSEVRDLLLACPGHFLPGGWDRRRDSLRRAAKEAGFRKVSLLAAPVAAALAPLDRPAFAPGDTVLVYDLGAGSFDTALVRFHSGGAVRLKGFPMALDFHGGADLDALIAADVRRGLPPGLLQIMTGAGRAAADPAAAGTLAADPLAAAQTGQLLADFARGIKHRLSFEEVASDVLFPGAPPYTLDRKRFTELAAELLADTLACSRRLIEGNGVDPGGLAGVIATGGVTRLPFVTEWLATVFGVRPHQPQDAELAVVTGATAWLGRDARRLRPEAPGPHRTPLSWPVPRGGARLERWLTSRGAEFRGGQPLALLRDSDGAQWRLDAPELASGVVVDLHAEPGQLITAGHWPLTAGPLPPPEVPSATGPVLGPPLTAHRLRHGGPVQWIAFHPGGTELAAAGGGAGVRVHGVPPGSGDVEEIGTPGEVLSLAYRRDGRQLLCAVSETGPDGSAGSVRLYDTATRELIREFGRQRLVYQAVFSPDGLTVATSAADRTVRIFRAGTGVLLQELRYPGRAVGLAFAADGRTLAAACADGVRLHDLLSRQVRHICFDGEAVWLAFSPDGKRIAVSRRHEGQGGEKTSSVLVHGVEDGARIASLPPVATINSIEFSPDGSLVAVGGDDGRVRLHSTEDWGVRQVLEHDSPVWSLAFAPRGTALAVGTHGGTVTVWTGAP
ncbi:Hsp70 family protein [Streptomyces sp. NPDC002044]|uniref:Hsp70 family protein n=1 Tax=Streptomyces sp. NPDC002044 TaxID=3154662 RepID=UPI003322317D